MTLIPLFSDFLNMYRIDNQRIIGWALNGCVSTPMNFKVSCTAGVR